METIVGHAHSGEDLTALTEEYSVWLDANDLPNKSADELLAEQLNPLDEAQRLFLNEFCRRWESALEL